MLSFIVPAHNEELLIGATIDAIHAAASATGEPHEIVVADDASTDGTSRLAAGRGARVVGVSHRQIAATRNAGARASLGEFLIFVDADTIVSVGAVRGALEAMRRGAAGGGCGIEFDRPVPLHARVCLPPMMLAYRLIGLASGSFLFCTREAFDAVGGFDETLFAGEEVRMSRAIGKVGRFVFLRERVRTSGRKLRSYSALEIYGLLARLALRGTSGVRSREGLDLWYGERRADPGDGRRLAAQDPRPRGGPP